MGTMRGTGRGKQIHNVMNRFDRRVAVRLRLAADAIFRRRRRFETDPGKSCQITTQTHHFSRALPGAVQDKHHQFPAGGNQLHPPGPRQPRKMDRVFARIEQHWKVKRTVNFIVDPVIGGKIHAFDEQGVTQAKMRHPAGAETVLGLARLGQDNETGLGIESLDERAVTTPVWLPATMAPTATLGRIGQFAGREWNFFR